MAGWGGRRCCLKDNTAVRCECQATFQVDPQISSILANVLDKVMPVCFRKVNAECIIWPTIGGADAHGAVHVAAMIHTRHLDHLQGKSLKKKLRCNLIPDFIAAYSYLHYKLGREIKSA